MLIDYKDFDCGITRIDVHYIRPGLAGSYLVVENNRAVLIETGPELAVPRILEALARKSVPRESVEAVIVTHVHLDHAGGAGMLLEKLPNARLYVHPKGVRHMIDPSKLLSSAKMVYGEARFASLLGGLTPAPADRTVTPADEERLILAGRELVFIHTPGHANHHMVIWDSKSRGIFSGDALGISYRELDGPGGRFLFPATTPVQLDPRACFASIDRLVALKPDRLHLTHFDSIEFDLALMDDLKRQLEGYTELAWSIRADTLPDKEGRLLQGIQSMSRERLASIGCPMTRAASSEVLAMDWEINVQGLNNWLDRIESDLG
ncbi:MAG: MBL fold metallo-hydrolase [Magnetococcales bacterium]|nr:MBL fold metallo-hydrolase [Magnetococcales bacterium]